MITVTARTRTSSARTRIPLNVVLTAGRPDLALWGVASTSAGFRVVQRGHVGAAFHVVSMPWPTLEQAQVDMHARIGG